MLVKEWTVENRWMENFEGLLNVDERETEIVAVGRKMYLMCYEK